MVKDINEDVDKVEYLLVDPWTMDATPLRKMYDVCENYGIVGATVGLPWDWWASLRGSIPLTVKDFFVHFDVLGPLFEKYTNWAVEYVKASIETGALDEIMLGGSTSSLSVISPRVFRSCNYEFINKVTDLCYEYNVPSHLHVCGRSRAVLDIIADTRLTVMEPLERPPGGDVDLREVKEKFGDKLVLKGNVNTFHTMAFGTPNDVKRECIECIKTAAYGGGFWLSTGDQIPAETPFKNITAMVEAAKEYGSYPLRP